MEPLHIILAVIGVLFAAAIIAAVAGRVILGLVYPLCVILCASLLGISITSLVSAAAPATTILPFGLPEVGVHLRLDNLSAFFGVIVNLSGMLASIYAIGYGRTEHNPLRVLPFYPAFLAGMNLVLIADDAFSFLVAWEFMSLASWALVVSQHREQMNRHAGYVYLLMANIGTIALLFAFGMLAGNNGGYGFDTIRSFARPSWMTGLALIMALIGAGSKAGLVPLHAWLPLAHPAAPTPVSALMSAVMTKVAIYAIVRIVFDLCGLPSWWWSVPFLISGGITAVLGILYALMQRDLKKLLAYSTVENVGIIIVALGLALAFKAGNMPVAAAVAMMAALLHILNHSLFKSLLFMGAGSILHATGHRDIERLGGLIHKMPVTAIVFLVGCAATAALPPLNGFVSEWMIFQAILVSPAIPQLLLRFLVPAVGVMLALAAALAATCFVKVYGIVFLGRPRSSESTAAHETDGFSSSAMIIAAVLCLLSGLFAAPLVEMLAPITMKLVGGMLPGQHTGPALFSLIPFAVAQSSYNAPLLLMFILISSGLTGWCIHLIASHRTRICQTWDCGFPDPSSLTQYTASGFAQPIRRILGTIVFHAREEILIPLPGETQPAVFKAHLTDLIWDYAYAPIATTVWAIAERLNIFQFLTIRRYLVLTFFALIVLLMVVAVWHS